jgi:hypothetical protein
VKRYGWSALSLIGRTGAATLLLATGIVSLPSRTGAETATVPVVVDFLGSQLLGPLMDQWEAALVAQNASVRLKYFPLNSPLARQKLVDQELDIAASAIGLLPDELGLLEEQRAAGKKPNVVTVPVAASSLNFAELYPLQAITPAAGPKVGFPQDIKTGPSGYTAEQLLTTTFVKQQFISDPTYADAHGYKIYDPSTVEQIPNADGEPEPRPPIEGEFTKNPQSDNDVRLIVRVGANAANFMLERYLKERFPAAWDQYTPGVGRTAPGEVGKPAVLRGDQTPSYGYSSSILTQNVAEAFREYKNRVFSYGLFVAIPPGLLKAKEAGAALALGLQDTPEVRAAHPEYFLKALEVDGIEPTPDSVAKALATSDGISSSDAVLPSANGGYPFSYINKLLVRTDGMSVARANALVTLIRYMVQDGQKEAAKINEPALPSFHVLKALKSTNEIIKAVCTPADRIRSTGKVTIAGEEVSFDECGPKVAVVATTTTAAATTTTTVAANSSSSSSSSSSTSTTQATVLNNSNTNTNSASRAPAATTAKTISPIVTAPATTAPPVASTAPPITAIALITTAQKKVVAAVEKEPDGPSIQPVSKPGRRRSVALPMMFGAMSFHFAGRFARKRASEDDE